MPFKVDIRVDRVPLAQVSEAWPLAEPWLREGAKVARETLAALARKIAEREADLWLISDLKSLRTVGAFVTGIDERDDGTPCVCVYALGGRGPWSWAMPLHRAIYQFAVEQKCAAMWFYGRREWSRFFPDFSTIDRHACGDELFEKAVP